MYELHVPQLSLESSIIFYGPVGSEVILSMKKQKYLCANAPKKAFGFCIHTCITAIPALYILNHWFFKWYM